jgi:hypothetical protein
MVLKAALLRWKPKRVPGEVAGFLVAFLFGILINYFIGGFLLNLDAFAFGLLGATLARLRRGAQEGPTRAEHARPAEERPRLDPPKDALSEAQLRKLHLEIEDLQRRGQWERRVARYVPPLTAALAAAGLAFGFYQFKSQQGKQHEQNIAERQKDRDARELEQRLRLQNQIRADLDRLLQFARDEEQTVSAASFLLSDLKALLASKVNESQRMMDIYPEYERNVTLSLLTSIKYDCDFSRDARDVRLATTVLDGWVDYPAYLRGDLDSLERLLYMHIRAVRRLRDDNPEYFKDLEYNEETGGFRVSARFEKQPAEERRYQHFLALKNGFTKHLRLLDGNEGAAAQRLNEWAVRNFRAALCNAQVSTGILQKCFADEPCDK